MSENSELLNGYCHFVNKTVLFVQKYFEGIVPAGRIDQDIYWKTKAAYDQVETLLNGGHREEAEGLLLDFLEEANRYFEAGRPWETCRSDRRACRNTILNCVQLTANLTVLLRPLLEDSPVRKVSGWFSLEEAWNIKSVHSGQELPRTEPIALVDLQTLCM